MTATEHEVPVTQPAHQIGFMDFRQVHEVEGIKYLEEGEGAPILFLHGIGGGAPAFRPQLTHVGRRYRAIAWEMPGYAGSVPLPLVTMTALAAALAGFIAALAPAAIRDAIGPGADPAGIAAAEACFAAVPESTYRDMILAMPGFDLRAALPRIAVPTLVIAGSKDRAAPAPGCEKMAARIPAARYALLENAGHLAHAERPAPFNAALDEFLAAL